MKPFPYRGKKFSTVHRFENIGHTWYVTYSSEIKLIIMTLTMILTKCFHNYLNPSHCSDFKPSFCETVKLSPRSLDRPRCLDDNVSLYA